ncbi:SgcJ/EcaC family oxidoreductase [Flavihumibacter fluvii]|uniref:SgcJ/EcaC family oxidoreductase n=1 Tax=Flavihumibacter fluvii TaxID=2838157 RepID=UPI001BDF39C9|nr:SgcJ/EcaC family oxidoreductase [Flavihumibacter fluvii]ULQ51729.1 SgcJ/EcaC family oxidoreductase [Flavihumibacter fluvii]
MNTEKITQNILTILENGWNNANGTEFAQPFADNAEFVDIRGTLHQNATRQFIGEAHQGVFMSIYKDSNIVYHLVQVIPLSDNIIVANVKAELDAPSGPLAGKSASTITMVLVNLDNTWKIRAFHNTLVAKQ